MTDVRALLKAKRQEARITHSLASYTTTGQLRCSVCGTNIKHASAWEGHLGSKAHRTNVSRAKEEEKARERQQAAQEAKVAKRKADEDAPGGDAAKRQKTEPATSTPRSSAFPSDFFSDPSKAPPQPPLSDDSDDEEVNLSTVSPAKESGPHAVAVTQPELDQEWIKFQQTVINAPDTHETYDRATVFAEPDLVSDVAEGFPPLQGEKDLAEVEAKLDPDEERRRKDQDEREMIMDRLLDEERAQEEADMKVSVMKSRLEALRIKREAARTKPKIAV
ncbi:hypothetical protein EV702DRAFT_587594 [Suillus placidus]|uniref:Coiled-coil domain-containing protein 16 n=1 Tax=Suillus placidus TaxID=48579 RepID=A0A9P7A2Z7_9AGAM|nr:hypothetical protein EV702DRAFT_587594 [Suillus placidus]